MALPSLYQAAQSLQLNIFLHRLNDRCDITGQILRRWLRHYLDQFLALYQHTHQPEQTAFQVRYIQTRDEVTPGPANTVATITLAYK
jgi:hypothetical protein